MAKQRSANVPKIDMGNVKRRNPRYGWRPDPPDHRDLLLEPKRVKLPVVVDLRPKCPKVYDQGGIGSCTANAIGGLVQFKKPYFMPARLFIYYNERLLEGSVDYDAGAVIRDGMKSLARWGVCQEKFWNYSSEHLYSKPSNRCYVLASDMKVPKYQRVAQQLSHIQSVLAGGDPIVFGFTVYESFETQEVANTGICPMPEKKESVLGGHAVALVGYDDKKKMFIVRNSWSDKWGDKGYFWMPYRYVLDSNLCADFWTINSIP